MTSDDCQSCTFNRSVTSPIEQLSLESPTIKQALTQCNLIFYKTAEIEPINIALNHDDHFLKTYCLNSLRL